MSDEGNFQNTITDLEILHGKIVQLRLHNSIIFGQMPSVTNG